MNLLRPQLIHGRRLAAAWAAAVFCAVLSAQSFAVEVREVAGPPLVKTWLAEEHSVGVVALQIVFEGGGLQDAKGKEGLTSMMADLMLEGAGPFSAEDISETLAKAGARAAFGVTRDAISFSLSAPSNTIDTLGKVVREVLARPRFNAESLSRLRAQRRAELKRDAANPSKRIVKRWFEVAFQGSDYARDPSGSEAGITGLATKDLQMQHRRLFARDVARVVVVGDISPANAARLVDEILGGLPANAELVKIAPTVPTVQAKADAERSSHAVGVAAFGFPGLPRRHPDYAALRVLNHILGSGDFDCVLMDELRVKRGLTYSVQTALLNDTVSSLVFGTFATKPERLAEAVAILKETIARVARDGLSDAQVEASRAYIVGSQLLDIDTSNRLASFVMDFLREGAKPDNIGTRIESVRRVTAQDVARLSRSLLDPDKLVVTSSGP